MKETFNPLKLFESYPVKKSANVSIEPLKVTETQESKAIKRYNKDVSQRRNRVNGKQYMSEFEHKLKTKEDQIESSYEDAINNKLTFN